MPARFHSNTYLHLRCRQLTVELFRFLTVPQSPLLQFPGFGIYICDLLKARMVVCSYNEHCSAPFSRAFWLVGTTKVYSGPGSRHCHGIITLIFRFLPNAFDPTPANCTSLECEFSQT